MSGDTDGGPKEIIPERGRRTIAAALMYGGWLACFGVFLYATLSFDPSKGEFAPQWVSFTFIASIGISIAAGAARGRMRLTDTIVSAFRAGMTAAELLDQERRDTEEPTTYLDGE